MEVFVIYSGTSRKYFSWQSCRLTCECSADSGVCSPCSYISSPCPPPGRPRYCDPHLSYMDRVVMEIVETEGVYVRDLHQVIQVSDCHALAPVNQFLRFPLSPSVPLLPGTFSPSVPLLPGTVSPILVFLLLPGTFSPSVPLLPGTFSPSVPLLPGTVSPSVPLLPGTFSPSVPLLPGTVSPILVFLLLPGTFSPSVPLLPGTFSPSVPLLPGTVSPSVPLLPGTFSPSVPLLPGTFSNLTNPRTTHPVTLGLGYFAPYLRQAALECEQDTAERALSRQTNTRFSPPSPIPCSPVPQSLRQGRSHPPPACLLPLCVKVGVATIYHPRLNAGMSGPGARPRGQNVRLQLYRLSCRACIGGHADKGISFVV
uniref:Uncharacterized protein n=1 Tax=Timema tahoe TaxID=61484 RepID=A0A7R9FLC4_9NEOP|nr:unnamed protein product [Timema tahoe]